VLGTANFLILAGSETTSTTLTTFIYLMVTNPVHLARVTSEVRSSFRFDADISISRTEELHYLDACLKETLRIFPAIAGGAPRTIAKGGRSVAGFHVPENVSFQSKISFTQGSQLISTRQSIVSVHTYAATHLGEYFKTPFEFHPERFLRGEGYQNDVLAASQPFSLGPRNCLGKRYVPHKLSCIIGIQILNGA
jgi:cytochrome P450